MKDSRKILPTLKTINTTQMTKDTRFASLDQEVKSVPTRVRVHRLKGISLKYSNLLSFLNLS